MKFNNDKDFILPPDVILLKFGPDPDAFKGPRYLDDQRGSTVLYELLTKTGLYSEEEVYDLFDEKPDFEGLIKGAWRYIKN